MLPHHARHADKMVLVRSLHHDNGDHFAGGHWMLTGRFGSTAANLPQKYPVGRLLRRPGARRRTGPALPAYVGLPSAQSVYLFPGYMGAAYLGPAVQPVRRRPRAEVPRRQQHRARSARRTGSTASTSAQPDQTQDRADLLRSLRHASAATSTRAA